MIKISVEEKNDIIIVNFFGELTSENFHAIDDEIQEVVDENWKILAFNLDGIEVIDSTGIGYLVKVRTKSQKNNARIILYNIPIRILEILYIAQLDSLFEILTKQEFEDEYGDK